MKPSTRLRPVVAMARESEQTAARALAEASSRVAAAEQKLLELAAYRDEYLDGLRYKTQAGLGAMQMQDYQVFLGRLDEAIHQQRLVLDSLQVDADHARATWMQEKQRLGALDKLTDRHLRKEQEDCDRHEQAETNEHALRNWRRALN